MVIITLFNRSVMFVFIILMQSVNLQHKSHDYYVSTTEINYNREDNTLQITIRMFVYDFEKMIKERDFNLKVDPDSNNKKVNQILNIYIFKNFKIMVNNKLVEFYFLGKEYKEDLAQVYYEINLNENINSITFENSILFDFFENQQNIIHFKDGKLRKSFLLNTSIFKSTLLVE